MLVAGAVAKLLRCPRPDPRSAAMLLPAGGGFGCEAPLTAVETGLAGAGVTAGTDGGRLGTSGRYCFGVGLSAFVRCGDSRRARWRSRGSGSRVAADAGRL